MFNVHLFQETKLQLVGDRIVDSLWGSTNIEWTTKSYNGLSVKT